MITFCDKPELKKLSIPIVDKDFAEEKSIAVRLVSFLNALLVIATKFLLVKETGTTSTSEL